MVGNWIGSSADGRDGEGMAKKTFQLTARVSTENPNSIQPVLEEVLPKGSVTETDEGFLIQAKIVGESARELNKELLSALRRVEKKTRLRSEWVSGKNVERYFDYVLKGKSPRGSISSI